VKIVYSDVKITSERSFGVPTAWVKVPAYVTVDVKFADFDSALAFERAVRKLLEKD
jgi:hypothetical protein